MRRIDSDLEAQRKGRSAFIRSAVLRYLDKQRREVDARIRRAYEGKADELLGEVEDLLRGAGVAKTIARGEAGPIAVGCDWHYCRKLGLRDPCLHRHGRTERRLPDRAGWGRP